MEIVEPEATVSLRDMRRAAGISTELMAVTLELTAKTVGNWERQSRPKAFQEMAYEKAVERITERSARRSRWVYDQERRWHDVPVLIDQRRAPMAAAA